MKPLLELRLPDDVLEKMPAKKEEMIPFLAQHLTGVVKAYDQRIQRRELGAFSGALSKYEKSFLLDFLMDEIIGEILHKTVVEEFEPIAASR